MSHLATPSRFIGCDVGKTAIVIHDAAYGRTRTIANEPQALAAFAASLNPTCFVVCEATGGYERDLLAALIAGSVPAHRADARKVKAFIRSFGVLGKSDAIERRRTRPIWPGPVRRTPALERPRTRTAALAGVGPRQTRPRQGSPRLRQSSRRPRRRARPPLSRGARRKLRGANQGDRSRYQRPLRRMRGDRQGRPNPGHDPGRRCRKPPQPSSPSCPSSVRSHPTPGRRPRRPCAPSQSKRPDRRLSPNPWRKTRKSNASSSWPQSPPQNTIATLSAFYKRLLSAGKKPLVAITAIMRRTRRHRKRQTQSTPNRRHLS